jgi:hypothetical protein
VTAGLIPNPVLTPQSLSAFNTSTNRINASGYDFAGNQTQDAAGSTFTYDGENNMITSTVGGISVSYFYDGDGRRVKRAGGGVTTVFVYNLLGQLIAEYDNLTTPPSGSGGTSYLTTDHLGSTRAVTGQDQSVKARQAASRALILR